MTALAALVLGLVLALPGGLAQSAAAATLPETVSADVLPTPQTDGIVFSTAIVGNVVFAAGRFTKARPFGVPLGGAGEVARTNILAFDLTTGALLPFAPVITSPPFTSTSNPGPFCKAAPGVNQWVCDTVFRVVPSPDQTKVYVVGDFTSVNGVNRYRAAAFSATDVNTATGTLDAGFHPAASSRVHGIAINASKVYLVGNFTSVNSIARGRVAGVSLTGVVDPAFAPSVDREAWTAALSPDNAKLMVGGMFDYVNGSTTPQHGIAAFDTATGANLPWADYSVIPGAPGAITNRSYPTDMIVRGSTLYTSVNGDGSGVYDGRFASNISDGSLVWINRCLGATQALAEMGGVLYTASHAHDCSTMKAWPERTPRYYNRFMAETLDARDTNALGDNIPTVLPLYITTDGGPADSYWKNGPWAVDAANGYVVLGGEFLTVNDTIQQQSLARFQLRSAAPKKSAPVGPIYAPTVRSLTAGSERVSWQATFDRDGGPVTYQVLRDGGSVAIATVAAPVATSFYDLPTLSFTDTGLVPGSTHKYRIRAVDADGNTANGVDSPLVTVAATSVLGRYTDAVAADGATNMLTFDEAAGATSGTDSLGSPQSAAVALNGAPLGTVFYTGVTLGQPGAISGVPGTAASFNGTPSSYAVLNLPRLAPSTFGVEAWFKTTTTLGGKILGFGNNWTGSSGSYDRHVYMSNNGTLNFGVSQGPSSPTAVSKVISTTTKYNDGQWHQVVGGMSSAGLSFYVDGALVGTDPTTTSGQYFEGYWRVGGDSVGGVANAPSSGYFNGSIDQVSIYPAPLTAAQAAEHYARRANRPPTAAFTASCVSRTCTVDGSASSDAEGPIVSYAWDFGDGTTATGATPPAHVYSADGPFTVTLAVTDNEGTTAQQQQVVNPLDARPVASFTAACDALTCTVDGTASSDPDGTVVSYAWDFGDGTTATGATPPLHTYAATGRRTITLTVTDNLGATGTSTQAHLGPNTPPTAVLAPPACTGRTCAVDAGGSSDPDGSIVSYAWSWGDGSAVQTATTPTTNHTYPADGTYAVTVTVTDDSGGTATATQSVTVVKAVPTALFSLSCTGRVCSVDGSGSSSPDGSITSYAWTWGDGSAVQTTTTPTTSHAYATDGTFTVGLVVTDSGAAVSPASTLTATSKAQGPAASFLAPTCTLMTCTVDASGSTQGGAPITAYSWNFGDGTAPVTAATPTASHTYATEGVFTITLTVTDANTLTATATRTGSVTRTKAADTFGRTVTGGWGAADVGGAWSTLYTASSYSVTAGAAKATLASAGATRSAWLPATAGTDALVTVDAAVSKLPSAGQSVWFYAAGRRIDENNSYRARVRIFSDGTVRLAVVSRVNSGNDVVIGAEKVVSGLTEAPGQSLRLRFQATGTSPTVLRAKVWLAAGAEPGAWQLDTTDSAAALQVAGAAGVAAYSPSANTVVPVDVTFSGLTVRSTL